MRKNSKIWIDIEKKLLWSTWEQTDSGRLCTTSFSLLSKGLRTNTQDLILSVGVHVPKWMEQSPSWKPHSSSAGKRISYAAWKSQVHCRFHKNPLFVRILSQINPLHALASYFFKLGFRILLPTTKSFFKFFHQNPMCISIFSHTCHMSSPSHILCSYGCDDFVSHIRENIHTESVWK
jgi:hypothetical protein